MIMTVFFTVHLIVVFLFFNANRLGRLYLDFFLTGVLCFLPVVGPITVFLINQKSEVKNGEREVSFEEAVPWLEDYQETVEETRPEGSKLNSDHLVPFREALLLNHAGIRRELVIDVMFEHPEEFVPLLHQARLNDDVEVVHYATTILSELTAKFDARLQKLSRQAGEASKDKPEVQLAYVDFLRQYIDSGIAEGHYAESLEVTYIYLMQRLMRQGLELGLENYQKLARLFLSNNRYEDFENLIRELLVVYPKQEMIWLLKLEGIVAEKSSAKLSQFYREISQKGVYFSAKGREILEVWQVEKS